LPGSAPGDAEQRKGSLKNGSENKQTLTSINTYSPDMVPFLSQALLGLGKKEQEERPQRRGLVGLSHAQYQKRPHSWV
jgi:hypothetical protein